MRGTFRAAQSVKIVCCPLLASDVTSWSKQGKKKKRELKTNLFETNGLVTPSSSLSASSKNPVHFVSAALFFSYAVLPFGSIHPLFILENFKKLRNLNVVNKLEDNSKVKGKALRCARHARCVGHERVCKHRRAA
jgi:hypothetical protein